MTPTVLTADRVSKSFGRNQVLDSVTFAIESGTIHALVGENGAGKSTLMNILSGALRPTEGRLLLDDRPLVLTGPRDAAAAGIAIVHQEFSLFPNRTVAQNIFAHREPTNALGLIRRRVLLDETRRLLADIGVDIDPSLLAGELSVGAQQLVEIAKALSLRARFLILDEPTSALSDHEAQRLFTLLDDLKSRGVGIVYISHRLAEVRQIADRISVLRDGRLVGTTTAAASTTEVVRMMVGRALEDAAPRRPTSGDRTVLEAQGLHRRGVFDAVSFAVREREILGFAGLVGSGRTEIGRALFGADPLDDGAVLIDGRRVTVRSPSEAIAHGIGYLTEDRKALGLFLPMSIRDNIVAAALPALVSRTGMLDARAIRDESRRHVQELDIRPADDRMEVSNLSGGNQQKVLLAKWLSVRPRVLIVDEPTRGVDVGAKAGIHRHLRALADQGVAVILISSDLPEVLALSDRIAVFRRGRLVAICDAASATQQEVMRHASA
ncbi:MAG: sugar ABC transporter ATP-binding protein [Bacteroidales bacterium]